MNRTLSLTLAFALALLLGASALAGNQTSGTTRITAVIGEVYTVKIPDDTDIRFNAASTSIGSIGLATANLVPGNSVTFVANVSDAGVGNLTHSNNTAVLPYTLKIDGAATNTASFAGVGTKPVSVDITSTDWNSAPAGSYSATITFTVSSGAFQPG